MSSCFNFWEVNYSTSCRTLYDCFPVMDMPNPVGYDLKNTKLERKIFINVGKTFRNSFLTINLLCNCYWPQFITTLNQLICIEFLCRTIYSCMLSHDSSFGLSVGRQHLARFHSMQWFSQLRYIFGKYLILWPLHTYVAMTMLLEGMYVLSSEVLMCEK